MVPGASRYRLATRVVADAPGPFRSISRLSHHSIPERVLALDAEITLSSPPYEEGVEAGSGRQSPSSAKAAADGVVLSVPG